VIQVVEHLPSKHKDPSSNAVLPKKSTQQHPQKQKKNQKKKKKKKKKKKEYLDHHWESRLGFWKSF
jgi:hypothetical protein